MNQPLLGNYCFTLFWHFRVSTKYAAAGYIGRASKKIVSRTTLLQFGQQNKFLNFL